LKNDLAYQVEQSQHDLRVLHLDGVNQAAGYLRNWNNFNQSLQLQNSSFHQWAYIIALFYGRNQFRIVITYYRPVEGTNL